MGIKRKKLIITIIPLLFIVIPIFFQLSITKISSLEPLTKLDRFGITEIYPTKSGGSEWFIDMKNPTEDPGFNLGSNITKQLDGSWQINGRLDNGTYVGEVRMEVSRLTGSEEWKNVEMTGYAKIMPSNNPNDSLVWSIRGGRHNSTVPCEGTALKGGIDVNGTVSWVKEIWHTGGYTNKRAEAQVTEPIIGRWIGWKVVVYNMNNDTAVKMESYLDNRVNNHWLKVSDLIDNGGWYANEPDPLFYAANCGKAKDHIIINGGPLAIFRSDNMTWNFRDLSVREIQPPSTP
ncbi:MAG TPA: hypothetical protein VJ599_07880 [Nitrososphaeraceae archaeon]|nr:hypothetical protein [Nitrososphaeraceae archaeon]